MLEKKWRVLGETLKRRGADEKSQDEIFKTPTALACNSFFFFYYIDFGIFLCIIPFIGMEFFSLVRLCVQMRDDLGVIYIL